MLCPGTTRTQLYYKLFHDLMEGTVLEHSTNTQWVRDDGIQDSLKFIANQNQSAPQGKGVQGPSPGKGGLGAFPQ